MLLSPFAVLILAGSTSALNISQAYPALPKCAIDCVTPIFSASSHACSLDGPNTNCYCTNATLQQQLLTNPCTQRSCSYGEQGQLYGLHQNTCHASQVPSVGHIILSVGIGFGVISWVAVILRLYARYNVTTKIWLDDWFVLVSVIMYTGQMVAVVLDHQLGFGKHQWDVSEKSVVPLLKLYLVHQTLYITGLATVRISILLLYYRIFTFWRFRYAVKIVVATVSVWGIVYIFIGIFRCRPIRALWHKNIPASCISGDAYTYSMAGIGICQDFIILLLPIPEVMALGMSLRKKISMSFLFGIGGFACITGIVRLKFIVLFSATQDSTWNNVEPSVWSLVENTAAIICSCIPAIYGLFARTLSERRSSRNFSQIAPPISNNELNTYASDELGRTSSTPTDRLSKSGSMK